MKHIGIFANSGAVATAIENEELLNPYVAMVSGVLDYDSVELIPDSGVGLTVITSDGDVYLGLGDEGHYVEFTKPYDSTFTIYWNGEVAVLNPGGWNELQYATCPNGDEYECEDPNFEGGCWGLTYYSGFGDFQEDILLEDIDFGTEIGESGDEVWVRVEYEGPSLTGCGEDEPYDEPCPSGVRILVSHSGCPGCLDYAVGSQAEEGMFSEEGCGCAGGDWTNVGDEEYPEYNCDCENASDPDECNCKLGGGYWTGTECFQPWNEDGGGE